MTNDLNCLRDAQVHETVVRAAHGSSFYATHFRGLDLNRVQTTEDLPLLPILYKDDARRAGRSMLVASHVCSHVQNTSGSTGPPLLIYRSREERDFITAFFSHVNPRSSSEMAIALALSIPHHGTPTAVPAPIFVLQSGVSDDELLEHTIVLLEQPFAIPGVQQHVTILTGSPSQVLALTDYVRQRGDVAHHVKHIAVTGRYLTEHNRRTLHEVWGAAVHDSYSLTEIFGGARRCARCAGFHFEPYVIPELVSPSSREPISEGVGVLLLTTLHPFVQYHPFIRYWTGDVFARHTTACVEPSFFFLGRASHTLFDPSQPDHVLIPGTAMFESVDGTPYVNRTEHFRDTTTFRNPQAAGLPILVARYAREGHTLHLRIQVEHHHLAPRNALADLAMHVRERLIGCAPVLADEMHHGRVALTIDTVPPGTGTPLSKKATLWEPAPVEVSVA